MKLKKIASLALAGVMAVSMLAGCKSGNSNNGGSDNEGPVTPVTTPVVDAVNKGQTPGNDVKIVFTSNSSLDAALAKAVEVYGSDADCDKELLPQIAIKTGFEEKLATGDTNAKYITNGFLNGELIYTQADDLDGKVYTHFKVTEFDALNDDAALNIVAEYVNQEIAKLAKTSKQIYRVTGSGDDPLLTGQKYYSYDYDGSISMVSVTNLDGTTSYYVAYVVNQTVTEKTL